MDGIHVIEEKTFAGSSGGARGVLGVLQPPYSHRTHGAPQHFSSMSEEEEEERRMKKKEEGGRKKKGK